MYDLALYDITDLFRIRDACVILARYDLHNKDLMIEISKEINEREKEYDPNDPDKERV